MAGAMQIIGAAAGVTGGLMQAQGAKAKKKALNAAEDRYYNALAGYQDQEHGFGMDEANRFQNEMVPQRRHAIDTMLDRYTGAKPANDGFGVQLADTVSRARGAVPLAGQADWAYSGKPTEQAQTSEGARTAERGTQLANTMQAEHDLTSTHDIQGKSLSNLNIDQMPIDARSNDLANMYKIGAAARAYQWAKKRRMLQAALRKAGGVGDQEMETGAIVSAAGGLVGGFGGGGGSQPAASGDSAPEMTSSTDVSNGGYAGQDYPAYSAYA